MPPFVIMVKQYLDFCRDTLRTIHNPEPWYGLTGKFVKNLHRGYDPEQCANFSETKT